MSYRPSIFAGMTQAQLQSALTAAQQAMIQLRTGQKGVSFSYAQGDGNKAVTYVPPTVGDLTEFIVSLEYALGIRHRARRPIRFSF